LIPDTQYDLGPSFDRVTNWIKDHTDSLNLKFVIHLGDIVNSGNSLTEWNSANQSISVLDNVDPYCLAVGNHDYGGPNTWGYFRQTFPVSRYDALPTWGGTMEVDKLENSYHLFTADGVDYLIITVEFLPRDDRLAWANSVVSAYPDRQVIYNTHLYMSVNDVRSTEIRYSGQNSGENQWHEFVKLHKNMLLTVNGHVEGDGY